MEGIHTPQDNRRAPPPVICLGAAVMDLLIQPLESLPAPGQSARVETISLGIGGCAANTAVGLAHLGVPVGLWARVGRDLLGDLLKQQLLEAGVVPSLFLQDPALPTKTVALLVGPEGDRRLLRGPGPSNALTLADLQAVNFAELDWLHIGGLYSLRGLIGPDLGRLLAQARAAGVVTSLDTVWTHFDDWETLLPLLPHLDYVLPSLAEAQQIAGVESPEAILAFLAQQGARTVVLKLGDQGSVLGDRGQTIWVPACPVARVLDTTGAGDAFCAGFIAARWLGLAVEQAVHWGNACGALTVQVSGATGGISSRSQVEALVNGLSWSEQ